MTGAGDGSRFAPEMLPVHSLLARSFARALDWRGDGRDPLLGLVQDARRCAAQWCLVVDERQGASTTLLGDPDWTVADPSAINSAGGRLLPLDGLPEALASGVLPTLVLVEPRSLLDPADLASAADTGGPVGSDARLAEQLLHRVYTAVREAERTGRRNLLVVTARGPAAGGPVPVLLVASVVAAGARLTTPLSPSSLRLLHRVVASGDPRAASDPGVLALAGAIAGPAVRWPTTSPAFAPPAATDIVLSRLRHALERVGLPDVPGESPEEALRRLCARAPGASLHSEQSAAGSGRSGRSS